MFTVADFKSFRWLSISPKNIFIWINAVVMLTGLIFLNWSAELVVVIYFFETIVNAIVSVFKLIFTAICSKKPPMINSNYRYLDLVAVPFYAVIFAFALFIQSVFAFVFLKMFQPAIVDPINLWSNFSFYLLQPEAIWIYGSIIFMNFGNAITQFFSTQKYKYLTVEEVAKEPIERITIQQIIIIITGYIFLSFKTSPHIAIVLVLTNLCIDLILVSKQKCPSNDEHSCN